MVENKKKTKTATGLFLLAIGLLFSYLFYLISSSERTLESWRASYFARRAAEEKKRSENILRKNQTRIFGELKIKYCGIEKDLILFDVFILELDPIYPYRYKIPKKMTKKGFFLSGRPFRITYFDPEKIRLEPGNKFAIQ
jgi:hypothetical protein